MLELLAASGWIQRSCQQNDMSSLLRFHVLVILLDALKGIQSNPPNLGYTVKMQLLSQVQESLPHLLFWISVNGHPVARKAMEVVYRFTQLGGQVAVLEALQTVSDKLWVSVVAQMDSSLDIADNHEPECHPIVKYLQRTANRTDFIAQPGSIDRQFFRLLMLTLFELVLFDISAPLSDVDTLHTVFHAVRGRKALFKSRI
jgi:hypothetical protein